MSKIYLCVGSHYFCKELPVHSSIAICSTLCPAKKEKKERLDTFYVSVIKCGILHSSVINKVEWPYPWH
jgi:hypothetical protein